MTVAELIEELQKLPPDVQVGFYKPLEIGDEWMTIARIELLPWGTQAELKFY